RADVAIGGYICDSDAVVMAYLSLAHLRVLARREEVGVRVERAEHAADGARHEVLGLDLVDVVALDRAERGREGLVVLRHLVVGSQGASSEKAAHESGKDDREQDGGEGTITAHDSHPSR